MHQVPNWRPIFQKVYLLSLSAVDLMSDFSDHLLKHVRNFATGGGHCLLWPKATPFLCHRRAYSRLGAAIVACVERPQGFICHKSRLPSGQVITLCQTNLHNDHKDIFLIINTITIFLFFLKAKEGNFIDY